MPTKKGSSGEKTLLLAGKLQTDPFLENCPKSMVDLGRCKEKKLDSSFMFFVIRNCNTMFRALGGPHSIFCPVADVYTVV